MQLAPDDIEESLERLRQLGVVIEVQGSGRATRYRHLMYEWLGVEKVELAVMAELLLRGAQTIGELRGRSARMEPIPNLAALRPHLDSLNAKGLIKYLTPEGRGCIVTHAMYEANEWERLRARYAGLGAAEALAPTVPEQGAAGAAPNAPGGMAGPPTTVSEVGPPADSEAGGRQDIELLGGQVRALHAELDRLRSALAQHCQESDRALAQIRQQLGMA